MRIQKLVACSAVVIAGSLMSSCGGTSKEDALATGWGYAAGRADESGGTNGYSIEKNCDRAFAPAGLPRYEKQTFVSACENGWNDATGN